MTQQEELLERLEKSLSYVKGDELYCKTTLYSIIVVAMKMAFTRGQDYVFYANPSGYNGDHTDYSKLKNWLGHNIVGITDSDINYFIETLKDIDNK